MAGNYAGTPFGLNDVKVKTWGGSTLIDVPAAAKFSCKPLLTSADLEGDDVLFATVSFLKGYELTLENGGLDFDSLATFLGKTVPVITGTGPNRTFTSDITGADQFGYVYIVGKMLGQGTPVPDVHAIFYKAKITDIDQNSGNGDFLVTSMTLKAVADSTVSNKIVSFVQHETQIAIT